MPDAPRLHSRWSMTRSALLILLILLLLAVVPTCASTDGAGLSGDSASRSASAPSWVLTPYQHPQVRRSSHMAGVGYAPGTSGAAREIAVQKALTDVTQTILSAIRSTVTVETNQRRENEDVSWTEELSQTIRLDSAADLPGYEVLDSWVDESNGETVVLVTVSRELTCSTLMPKVEQALTEAQEFLNTPADFSSSNPAQALFAALQAYGAVSERMLDATKAQVVADHSPLQPRAAANFRRATSLLDEASLRLANLAGAIRIDKVSGDGQRSAVRGSLPQRLSARFTVISSAGQPLPLAHFPARFVAPEALTSGDSPHGGPALAHSSSTTDNNGLIFCSVSDLVPTGMAANEIFVEADFGRLAPSIGRSRTPSESFVYHLPTSGQTSILVLLTDTFENAPLATQISGEELGDHLSSFGFDVLVVDPSSSAGKRLAASSDTALPAEITTLYDNRFEYAIHGRSTTRYSSQTPVGHFYYSLATLQIDNLSSGSSQAVATNEAKGGHPNKGLPGIKRALASLRMVLAKAVDEQFVSEFVIDSELNP
ncbi:MAG: hypothetical protein ACI9EF_003824 [Pseudohongiellaceae bacterium]|jgi:hypothetical protein